MKIKIISLLLFAALFGPALATPAHSTARPNPDVFVSLDTIDSRLPPRRVANGMTRDEVNAAAGTPGAMLDGNVWAYWNFTAQGVPLIENLDTLLVVFSGDRVGFMKLVSGEPVRAFIAQQEKFRAVAAAKAARAK